jgi:cytolysin (calcineurin-like family phosphatase)
MHDLQIKLLYCQYGWDTKRIAAAIGQAETYVKQVVAENKWKQGTPSDPYATEPDSSAVQVIDGSGNAVSPISQTDQMVKRLQELEVVKQAELAPIYAVAEITLATKLAEAIESVDTKRDDAHVVLQGLTKALKQMTQDTVSTKVVDGASEKTGVNIQVITQIS